MAYLQGDAGVSQGATKVACKILSIFQVGQRRQEIADEQDALAGVLLVEHLRARLKLVGGNSDGVEEVTLTRGILWAGQAALFLALDRAVPARTWWAGAGQGRNISLEG